MSSVLNEMLKCIRAHSELVYCKYLYKVRHSALTDIGAGLFPYMLMLENSDRKSETRLIEEYRTIVFGLRDDLSDNKLEEASACFSLENLYEKMKIHSTLLKTIPDLAWEEKLLRDTMNDILMLKSLFSDN